MASRNRSVNSYLSSLIVAPSYCCSHSYRECIAALYILYPHTLSSLILYVMLTVTPCYSYANENVNKLLVGNKSDLASKRVVTFDQGKVQTLYIHVS